MDDVDCLKVINDEPFCVFCFGHLLDHLSCADLVNSHTSVLFSELAISYLLQHI